MPQRKPVIQFGTEIVASADGTIAGLLGASPGASTAVPIMLDLLKRCFPDRRETWAPKIEQHDPDVWIRVVGKQGRCEVDHQSHGEGARHRAIDLSARAAPLFIRLTP